LKLEWGVQFWPDYYEAKEPQIAPMKDEATADEVCQEGQCVVFRYVGEWTKA
jgi:hypothetical protein